MPSVKKSFLLLLMVGVFLFSGCAKESTPPVEEGLVNGSEEPTPSLTTPEASTSSEEPVITLSQSDVSFQGAVGSHCYQTSNAAGETGFLCEDMIAPLELFELFGIDFQTVTSLQFKIDTGLPATEITVVVSPKNNEFQAYDATTQKITDQKYSIDLSGIEKGTSFIVGIQARYEGGDMMYEFPLEF